MVMGIVLGLAAFFVLQVDALVAIAIAVGYTVFAFAFDAYRKRQFPGEW